MISCPANTCSGHGTCVSDTVTGDHCSCASGYTGYDCATAIPAAYKLKAVPYGLLYPNDPYWNTGNDAYGDAHPLFQLNAITNIYVQLTWADYVALTDGHNMWNNATKHTCTSVVFDNGVYPRTLLNVTATIKNRGQYTQAEQKKGYNIALSSAFLGVKTYSLKATFGGDGLLADILVADFYRTLSHPVQRQGYASLWINGIYFGGYNMQEKVDRTYYKAHWTNAQQGNTYSVNGHPLDYWGPNPTDYSTPTTGGVMDFGAISDQPLIESDEVAKYPAGSVAPPTYTDYAWFVGWLNNNTASKFAAGVAGGLDTVFETQQFHRALTVETFFECDDNWLASSSNYYLVDEVIDANYAQPKMFFMEYDYDLIQNGDVPTNIYSMLAMQGSNSPLTSKLYSLAARKNEWTNIYRALLNQIFPATQPAGQPTPAERHLARAAIFKNTMDMDKWFTLVAGGETGADFQDAAASTAASLAPRAAAVRSQFKNF